MGSGGEMNASQFLLAVLVMVIGPAHRAPAQTNWSSYLQPGPGILPRLPASGAAVAKRDHIFAVNLSDDRIASNAVVVKILTGEVKPNRIKVTVTRFEPDEVETPGNFLHLPLNPNKDYEERRKAVWTRLNRLGAQLERGMQASANAPWMPFTPEFLVDLGPGEGERGVTVAAEWDTGSIPFEAQTVSVRVDCTPPTIIITSPTETVTSQPIIQLQGYSDEPLASIRYDVISATSAIKNQEGGVTHQSVDPISVQITTNFFECVDVDLALGTNTILLRCEDRAGNVRTNTLTYVLGFDFDKTPPVISLVWPQHGRQVAGTNFTPRGRLDDPTARLVGEVSANGKTVVVEGLVERDGKFWVEHMPLLARSNFLMLLATDAAGNESRTNLVVLKSDDVVIIDPVPTEQLWKTAVTVTGRVSPPNQDVWVNGVQAVVEPEGTWRAKGVNPGEGGTAVFSVTAIPKPSGASIPAIASNKVGRSDELISVQANLGTNSMTLNATQPACQAFRLRLSGTTGRQFILLASTNLTDWIPILTNLNEGPTFEYEDQNAMGFGCRFFRVVPLP